MGSAKSGQSKRSIVRLASILAFAGVVFGGGIAAGATGTALMLGRTNDAGTSRTTLRSTTSSSVLAVQQLGSGPALTLNASTDRGSALKVGRGAIEIDGAGVNTPTAAFRMSDSHQRRVQQQQPPEASTIRSPTADQRRCSSSRQSSRPTRGRPPCATAQTEPSHRAQCGGFWYIERPTSAEFNVLVIKP